jgi:hypothetical protein
MSTIIIIVILFQVTIIAQSRNQVKIRGAETLEKLYKLKKEDEKEEIRNSAKNL